MILETKFYKTEDVINIAGSNESKLKIIENYFDCDITIKGEHIITNVSDDKVIQLDRLFQILLKLSNYHILFTTQDITYIIQKMDEEDVLFDLYLNRKAIINNVNGRPIYPKTLMQKEYIDMIQKNAIVLASGAAGTGKTYLAITMAVKMLKENQIKKIILTRPAVEAGESLGFLPGDLKEKIDPYLRPLYDALYDCLGKDTVGQYIEKGVVEIAPLAYMRGRTLDNACIILDEAQNATKMQMKMFLTRLGYNSKMIVTGDISQIDLPTKTISGLKNAIEILSGIRGLAIIQFETCDVIRHPLVQEILKRYED